MKQFNRFDEIPLNAEQTDVNHYLRLVAEGKLTRNLLLFGRVGTGKTTLAHNLPRLYELARGGHDPVEMRVFECDVDFSVDSLGRALTTSTWNKSDIEWIVLDEVDKLSSNQRKPLHSLLGKNKSYGHPAILIANEIYEFGPGLLSRCQPLEIVAPRPDDYLPYAMKQIMKAGKQLDETKVLTAIEKSVDGFPDIRKYEDVVEELCN